MWAFLRNYSGKDNLGKTISSLWPSCCVLPSFFFSTGLPLRVVFLFFFKIRADEISISSQCNPNSMLMQSELHRHEIPSPCRYFADALLSITYKSTLGCFPRKYFVSVFLVSTSAGGSLSPLSENKEDLERLHKKLTQIYTFISSKG